MIKFDAVDFSEHRSEEVVSFFWPSVYYLIIFKLSLLFQFNFVVFQINIFTVLNNVTYYEMNQHCIKLNLIRLNFPMYQLHFD